MTEIGTAQDLVGALSSCNDLAIASAVLKTFAHIVSIRFAPKIRAMGQSVAVSIIGNTTRTVSPSVFQSAKKCLALHRVSSTSGLRRLKSTLAAFLFSAALRAHKHRETLKELFGEAYSILEAMWTLKRAPYHIKTNIAANWKLLFHITLDDYHIVAVHPDTFGKNGYLPLEAVRYFRLGPHSAYFYGGDDDEVKKMANELRHGNYRSENYRIIQFFPNLLALHVEAAMNWYVLIQQYVPLSPGRSLSRSWYFPAPFPPVDRTWLHGLARRIVAPFVPFVLPFYIRKIFSEDNGVCEQIQTVAAQIRGFPILGRHEERIKWFEETYANIMADAPKANVQCGAENSDSSAME